MEFDIGTILYIIITLVAVIIGLLGRKKTTEGGATRNEDSGEGGFMENLERALTFGEEDQRFVDREMVEEQPTAKASDYESFAEDPKQSEGLSMMKEYNQYLEREGAGDPDRISAEGESAIDPLQLIELDEEYGTDYFEVVKDFDAGTAVIYSAIINRVDY